MCGRFSLTTFPDVAEAQFGVVLNDEADDADDDSPAAARAFIPRYNIAPSQPVWSVYQLAASTPRQARQMRWGIVPSWAKNSPTARPPLINLRSETLLSKPAFRQAFLHRRCLIPADGFYEWKHEGAARRPFRFTMQDESVFAFAGLWESSPSPARHSPAGRSSATHSPAAQSPAADTIECCAILTTAPNQLVHGVHDRMPVILPQQHYSLWLGASPADPEQLLELCAPYPADEMKRYAVSALVNSPKNDTVECVMPI